MEVGQSGVLGLVQCAMVEIRPEHVHVCLLVLQNTLYVSKSILNTNDGPACLRIVNRYQPCAFVWIEL